LPQWDVKLDWDIRSPGIGGIPSTKQSRDARDEVILVDRDGLSE